MSSYDLIIRNGMLVTPDALVQADLGIAGEQIVDMAPELEGTSENEVDAAGLHIFPGVIDAHLHFNEPGRADWEGFATGTAALAAGGTTTYFDMPLNSHPPTIDAAAFDLKCQAAISSSLVDFGLWGGLVPGSIPHMEELAARGVVGFKAFMSNSGIEDFPASDDLTLYEGMQEAARLGCLVAVHAENDTITGMLARRAVAEGRTGVRDYLQSRPVVAELEAITRAITFAGDTSCRLHIVHVSSGRGVSLVAEAQSRGVDVSCETCPHYLVLTEEDVERLGAVAKCAPPVRSRQEQDELWAHIYAGTLPMVASDHSPAPAGMKSSDNFFQVWGGISGCQSLLQLLLTEGHAGRDLPFTTIASLTAGYPAQRFGVSPRKGRIEVGADADLALVDLSGSHVLLAEDLLYRHKHSPYVGRTLRGRVVRTLVRGKTVWLDGKVISRPLGRLVTPVRSSTTRT
ncbi:MAG: allantoinase [Chloroflexota bacterium]|nr:allantoinase [Chloroflexota bacterium]MDQ5865121.1 allantoinase [Chloroflexota bacterium]